MSENNTPELSDSYLKTRAESQEMYDRLIANSQESEPQK